MQLRNQSCAIRGVAQSELRNPESCAIRQMQLRKQSCAILRVAQSVECSCAIRVAQSGELRNLSCAILRVAQSKLRNPSCAIRPKSCAIRVAQSSEVSESDFIPPLEKNLTYESVANPCHGAQPLETPVPVQPFQGVGLGYRGIFHEGQIYQPRLAQCVA